MFAFVSITVLLAVGYKVFSTVIEPMLPSEHVDESAPFHERFQSKIKFVYRVLILGPIGMGISVRTRRLRLWFFLSLVFVIIYAETPDSVLLRPKGVEGYLAVAIGPSNIICAIFEFRDAWKESHINSAELSEQKAIVWCMLVALTLSVFGPAYLFLTRKWLMGIANVATLIVFHLIQPSSTDLLGDFLTVWLISYLFNGQAYTRSPTH
ncbi:MAG: hypothetical protein K2W86_11540 [Sphingomonas sp.]|uniref:hypothetical protein n=1 Tax=Sphingomonas sp. TaxID=28214 RepID=UPI0035A9056C|nr:hypothetical protein [Sphingomonas sp.]